MEKDQIIKFKQAQTSAVKSSSPSRKRLYEEQKNAIEQDMAPFGFMDDGMGDDNFVDDEGDRWFKANQKVVLATVIQTWGSSPRQVGSRMIVNETGDFSGSVSGGCVESAVVRECIGLIKLINF